MAQNSENQVNGGYQPNKLDLQALVTVKNLNTFSSIAAPVSLLFGGVLLSTASLVCAVIALVKVNKLTGKNPQLANPAMLLKKSTIIALVFSVIALALNVWSVIMLLPTVIAIVQTGDISSLMSIYGLSSGAASGAAGSVTFG